VLVNLARWMKEPVKVPSGCTYLARKIEDDPDAEPDEVALRSLARLLAERVSSGATVASYCAGGLNRSGLVAGTRSWPSGWERKPSSRSAPRVGSGRCRTRASPSGEPGPGGRGA
jgi:hypothetical protein